MDASELDFGCFSCFLVLLDRVDFWGILRTVGVPLAGIGVFGLAGGTYTLSSVEESVVFEFSGSDHNIFWHLLLKFVSFIKSMKGGLSILVDAVLLPFFDKNSKFFNSELFDFNKLKRVWIGLD